MKLPKLNHESTVLVVIGITALAIQLYSKSQKVVIEQKLVKTMIIDVNLPSKKEAKRTVVIKAEPLPKPYGLGSK